MAEHAEHASWPEEVAILPVRDTVVYPGAIVPISVGREKSMRLLQDLQEPREVPRDKLVAIVTQRDIEIEEVSFGDLYEFGTLAKIHHVLQLPNQTAKIILQGLERIRLIHPTQEEPFFRGKIEIAPDFDVRDHQVEGLMRAVTQQLRRYAELIPGLPEDLLALALNSQDPNRLAYLVGFNLNLKLADRQSILDVDHPYLKLGKLSQLLGHEIEIQELGQKIQNDVQDSLGKSQRDYYLREQLRAIHKELGEEEDPLTEVTVLRKKLEEAQLPEEAKNEAERELCRLEKLPFGSAEHPVIRHYLDWLVALPWGKSTNDSRDLVRAKTILDEDHFDLTEVKERILEYLAVYKLKAERSGESSLKGPILCLVGPPGVGK
ncbi:MAG TPA: endopeptidase La, partial [Cyanobacteria bacterium UBA8530]|nr:endopeptidase La [Cyanobacteria bacterium UBA8530]